MRAKLLLCLLLLYSSRAWAQNLSIQESFETSTGNYGYTSNTFNTSLTQYFYRAQNPVSGFGNPAGSANMLNVNGSYFWACEGVRGTGNTTPAAGSVPGIVTLNAINNTQSYTDLKVIVAAGDPRSGANIARTTDHLRVQYAYGDPNGTYTTLFEFTGTVNGGSSSWTRVAVQGTNVTGTAAVLSSTFSDHESSIPGGLGALYIRVEADYQGANKELAFDNIRVTGTRATSAPPQLANIESTSVNYAEGSGSVQITNTMTVSDADNTTLTGGTVRISANLEATEDLLLFTNQTGITGSYSTSMGVLTLSGTATLAAYQAALRSVQYQNTDAVNASPLARTIAFGVTDPNGVTSNVATRTITVTTALNAASALPYTENFDTDGEGTRYGSNTRVSNSQGFVRLTNASGGSATPGSGFVNGTTTTFTNVQGSGYWYTNGTQGGIVSGSVGQLTLAPVNSTGFVNLHFKVRVGAASSGGGFTSDEFLRFSYSTNGGTSWTTFANYTGASGQLYLDGNTANPVLDTSLDNADFSLPGIAAGATISFRAETNSGGSEQIVFDDIQITGLKQTTVNSLVRASANPTNAATVNYTVTFGAPVTGLAAANFSLTSAGTLSGSTLGTPTVGTGTTWTVPVNTGSGSGSLTLSLANDTNLSADITTSLPFVGETYTIDKTAPTVSRVTVPANGSYRAGQTLSFIVNFSEAVTVTASPQVALTIGSTSRQASYASGSGTTSLVFSYTVQSGDLDTDGIALGALTLSGGTLRDAVGNNATLTLNNVPATAGVLVDAVAPTVAINSSTAANGSSTGTTPFAYTVTFSENVMNFAQSGLTVAGGTISNFTAASGSTYTFSVTPSGNGTTVTVNIAAGAAQDAASNGNTAAPAAYLLTFVAPTIVVAPSTLVKGTTNTAYSQTITASGGMAPYSYAITAGALPTGLTLASNGVLSGTPTAAGSFTFTVTATDASAAPGPASGSQAYSVSIGSPDLVISTSGQTVLAGTYNSITVQRGGEATLAGTVTVNGDVTVQSGGVLKDGCALLSGAGSFTLAAGGTLSICSPQGISSSGATGTVQVTGTRSFSPDALYTYTGTVAQVTGTGLPATVRALTLTNPAGLSLTNALTTTTAATFISGVLTTGANTLTLGSDATLGEDADGYVMGTVQATRTLATAGSPEAFGGLGLMLTPSGSTLPGSTLVQRVTGTALRGTGSSTSIKRYFDIQPTVNTGLNVALVLTFRDDERNGIAPANLRLFKSEDNGANWRLQAATYSTATVGSLTTYSASLSGISDFSLWTLGDAAAPLPVTLTSFQALVQDENRALLRWATASELHSAYFAVERSIEGRAFVEVGRVVAAGISLSAHTYELRDPLPLTGPTYYRLRQVDADKSVTYSPVVTLVPRMQAVAAVSVYPNPRTGTVSTSVVVQGLLNQQLIVQVTDMLGRTVSTQQFTPTTHQEAVPLHLPADLAAGVYGVSVNSGKQTWTTRLFVAP